MNSLDIPNIANITDTVTKIKNGEIKVYDLVKEHLDRAHAINPQINAFITILDDALEKAKEIDDILADPNRKSTIDNRQLLGIPFTVKDLYLVDGTKTTFGSKFMKDFIAPYTATVVQKLLDEGAILIGKCNCDPWGFGSTGENSGYGPTKHPLDFDRSPGGSSSGSAASLLAGVGFFSLGTDTGGSVRQPAAMCGLYGMKPTYGRNSRYGIGSMASSFDTPGFFARYASDIKMLEEIMQGKDENDATTEELSVVSSQSSVNTENRKPITDNLVIGLPKEYFEGLNPEIKNVIMQKAEELKAKGHEVKEVSIPSTKYGLAAYYILVPSEISSNRARYDGVRFGPKIAENYYENLMKSRGHYFEDEVKRRIMIGTFSLSTGYADQFYNKASKVREKLKREYDKAFEEVDLMIAPVAPSTAIKIGEKTSDPVAMYLEDVYTVTANLVGIPSLTIPAGKDANGLPIGMQIMANKFEDEKIIEFAKSLDI